MQHIVIIGTGLAGYLLAKEFRKYDMSTPLTLITKSDGCFYSKPLLSTALTQQKTPNQLIIADAMTLREQLNATILTKSDVFHIDADNKKIFFRDEMRCEHTLCYGKLVLANGAHKINTFLAGDAADDVLFVNQLEDYRVFREKLLKKNNIAILGTGLIGCEFANDLVNAGYTVKLISPDRYLLSTCVPEIIGLALEKEFHRLGVQFYGSVLPTKINQKDAYFEVILSDKRMVTAELVLSAIGIKPDLTLAKTANLKINNGIVVNASLQTSNPAIFALGECAEVSGQLTMHVAPILKCVHALAKVLVGREQCVYFETTPVVIKTPACPVVVVAPPKNCIGEWKIIASESINIQSLFYDDSNRLRGFALSGDAIKEKNRLIKLMMG
ncbi:MAG: hypothetical protein A3E82_08835 [Gammaproteobacteria bacterium RIFCSPHIGHO2_12_FULL_38_11]|nr:MAG: hypothetical protein A3E82_08835 [Gammaproteobacteria bacterium RIFCSPHIGHO2_12_FULL_38_11]